MIEDKKLGLKIAETKDEKTWGTNANQYEQNIAYIKSQIEGNKEILNMSPRKIERMMKDKAKAEIKALKYDMRVQKVFLQFCQSKVEEVKK